MKLSLSASQINGRRIDLVRGHRLVDDDKIEVGPPLSALMDTSGNHTSLTFKLDVMLTPPAGQADRTPYKVLGLLGRGSFGYVLSVQHTRNKEHLAIKAVETNA